MSHLRDGYRTVSAYLIAPDARAVKAFAETAFGAEDVHPPVVTPEGRMMHAAVAIGDSVVLIGQPPDGMPAETAFLHVYVEDCDATFAAAVSAGGKSLMEPSLQPHGDRAAMVEDIAGNKWWIATYMDDVPYDEMMRRMASAPS